MNVDLEEKPRNSCNRSLTRRFFTSRPLIMAIMAVGVCFGVCAVVLHPQRIDQIATTIHRCLFDNSWGQFRLSGLRGIVSCSVYIEWWYKFLKSLGISWEKIYLTLSIDQRILETIFFCNISTVWSRIDIVMVFIWYDDVPVPFLLLFGIYRFYDCKVPKCLISIEII